MQRESFTTSEAVKLMTSLHMAMADAMTMTWFEKYTYRTARPITVIRGTDPYWNSYLGNPPFPAYPSGHAAVSAAAAEVIADVLGEWEFTDNRFRGNSGAVETLNSAPRTYPGVRAAAEEAGLSRVWGGIHFMTDYEGGRRIGLCTAGVHGER
jgi:membrane-associated phospholipid phosphatase